MATMAGTSGLVVTAATTAIGTATLIAIITQIHAIGHGWLDWQGEYHPTFLHIASAAAGLLTLQSFGFIRRDTDYIFHVSRVDWRASENIGPLLAFLWALLLDLLHSGPRMITHATDRLTARRQLRGIDQDTCARVLSLLHCSEHRVSFAEMSEFNPGFDQDTHVPQLLLLPGILHLPSEPPGLSLSTDLRKILGAPTQAQKREARTLSTPTPEPEPDAQPDESSVKPDESAQPRPPPEPHAEEIPPTGSSSAKSPAFRCTGCRRKFRLRNLQGGVTFSCPRCGEIYRTIADTHNRVRIERQSEDYDPTADLSIMEDGAEAYFLLGLHPAATETEVKKAYRSLMKEYHPDKAIGISPVQKKLIEERAREINRAYGQIMDRKRN